MVAMYATSGDIDSAIVLFDCIRQNASTLLFNLIIRVVGALRASEGEYPERIGQPVCQICYFIPFKLHDLYTSILNLVSSIIFELEILTLLSS
ncbi:hypothetical protein L6452_18188 [Arctium lappa]|uniref:Uncharacterized protein n=1 Tax=Arctium lappa TaxID=4217 RepID=A0ACB9C5T3_ARCLA|nr:hypothetical protein L6452_18188 [Arctium lappa]